MDRFLILKAARAIKEAYRSPGYNILSTEWSTSMFIYKGRPIQCIAIAGTNDPTDWLWNLLMLSWKGVKLGNYVAAQRIFRTQPYYDDLPLMVCGHSKAGATAIYLGKLLKADYAIAFNPAPGFRGVQVFENSLVVVDPNDLVHKLGTINFNQPMCDVYRLPNDKKGIDLLDHGIDNSIQHFSNIKE